ncbi:CLC_0170 family protein [Paenibacillus baimaensis]|uniref:CLC_0170 family protein n=1 Tax=Paenibacillus baimaensis TaxID=2982185 RepID=UPI0038CD4AD9
MYYLTIGYIGYIELLFILTGLILLLFEAGSYKKQQLFKEEKIARILGWCNCSIGIFTFLGYWVYNFLL